MDAVAKPWLAKIEAEQKKLETFADVLAVYVAKSPTFSHKHWCQVRQLERDLGTVPLRLLPQGLEAYLSYRRTHDTARGRPLSDGSHNRVVDVVHAAFELCLKLELLHQNPISRARFPRFKLYARDRILTPDEHARLFPVLRVEAPHLYAAAQYSYLIPCRKSELVNARKDRLDLGRMAFWVPNGTTKNGLGIWKPIPPPMGDYFRNIPASCPWLFYRFGNYGEPLPLGDFKHAWHRALEIAGIKDFRWHDLRHCAVTGLLNAGTPEQVVMQIAGWKTNMVQVYYRRSGLDALSLVRYPANFAC